MAFYFTPDHFLQFIKNADNSTGIEIDGIQIAKLKSDGSSLQLIALGVPGSQLGIALDPYGKVVIS